MPHTNGRGLAGTDGEAPKLSSNESGRDLYKPSRPAALAALRRSLAAAREPALRERLAAAIARLEARRVMNHTNAVALARRSISAGPPVFYNFKKVLRA